MKVLKKILKITGIILGSILLLMFLLPILFPDFVGDKIKQWTNGAITTELNFSKARLSFFNHFPSLTLTLHDVSLMGSAPYAKDTLLKADEVSLGIDLSTVFSQRISIDEIYLTRANIFIKVDEDGTAVKALSDVLQAKGYSVVESDGKELVEKAVSTQPDIIILNSVLSGKQEIVQSLRFEKGLENVLFLIYQ